ncbi:hypothetical protein QQS21_004116 [Conoideocrella luteorostrata]|uniref:Uncharacterized protein n=1 Tax=Conoideocrella luteorostrata TaxID=1105319 RepID=A0AAJ0CV36_9HYPO|nr:hypothetical protein QQS21_004116 [Conoideocrella luteorostrata]
MYTYRGIFTVFIANLAIFAPWLAAKAYATNVEAQTIEILTTTYLELGACYNACPSQAWQEWQMTEQELVQHATQTASASDCHETANHVECAGCKDTTYINESPATADIKVTTSTARDHAAGFQHGVTFQHTVNSPIVAIVQPSVVCVYTVILPHHAVIFYRTCIFNHETVSCYAVVFHSRYIFYYETIFYRPVIIHRTFILDNKTLFHDAVIFHRAFIFYYKTILRHALNFHFTVIFYRTIFRHAVVFHCTSIFYHETVFHNASIFYPKSTFHHAVIFYHKSTLHHAVIFYYETVFHHPVIFHRTFIDDKTLSHHAFIFHCEAIFYHLAIVYPYFISP